MQRGPSIPPEKRLGESNLVVRGVEPRACIDVDGHQDVSGLSIRANDGGELTAIDVLIAPLDAAGGRKLRQKSRTGLRLRFHRRKLGRFRFADLWVGLQRSLIHLEE